MAQKRYIFIVMSRDILFGAYTSEKQDLAYTHARTILGADVVPCEVFDQLPNSVKDDINIDEYGEVDETPVIPISLADIKDKP